VEIVRTAQKQILALPGAAQMEIAQAIDPLVSDPRPAVFIEYSSEIDYKN